MIESGQDWTDVVFVELMKRTDSIQRKPCVIFKYKRYAASLGYAFGSILRSLYDEETGLAFQEVIDLIHIISTIVL